METGRAGGSKLDPGRMGLEVERVQLEKRGWRPVNSQIPKPCFKIMMD